ncbi:MAG TPA: hypothetical protein VEI05_06440 [Burkholderiaceae bacterium]|nr:hypothetical protein [Burkholderiaceae bacterium]
MLRAREQVLGAIRPLTDRLALQGKVGAALREALAVAYEQQPAGSKDSHDSPQDPYLRRPIKIDPVVATEHEIELAGELRHSGSVLV